MCSIIYILFLVATDIVVSEALVCVLFFISHSIPLHHPSWNIQLFLFVVGIQHNSVAEHNGREKKTELMRFQIDFRGNILLLSDFSVCVSLNRLNCCNQSARLSQKSQPKFNKISSESVKEIGVFFSYSEWNFEFNHFIWFNDGFQHNEINEIEWNQMNGKENWPLSTAELWRSTQSWMNALFASFLLKYKSILIGVLLSFLFRSHSIPSHSFDRLKKRSRPKYKIARELCFGHIHCQEIHPFSHEIGNRYKFERSEWMHWQCLE